MSAYKNLTTDALTTSSLVLQGSGGVLGESVYFDGTNPVWNKLNKSALYTDSTSGVQNMNGAPTAVSFDNSVYDEIGLDFSGTSFRFPYYGRFMINFECLLSDSSSQCMISFFLNSNHVYGNLSVYTPGLSGEQPFYSSYLLEANPGDTLEIIGEKNINGPNYLQRDPIYGSAITKLEIVNI